MRQIHPESASATKGERGLRVSDFSHTVLHQAMWYAVDRSVIQRVVHHNQRQPAWSPFPPGVWAQDRDVTDRKRDPARAKPAEGRAGSGRSFTVKDWNSPARTRALQIIPGTSAST